MRSELILAMLGATAVLSMGCSQAAPTPVPGFVDNTGEAPASVAAYPAGPFGINVGSVIPNFDFQGFPNAMSATNLVPMELSAFYNPHGKDATYQPAAGEADDRLFPMDSGYKMAGQAKPTVLLIDIASVWCGPCNQEAQTLLPFKHAMYQSCGGEFLLNLHDSNTPGQTATQANLKNWTKAYKVDYPGVIDPEYKLDALFAADAFPNNMIIDTTTMKIVHVVAGEVIPGICSDGSSVCGTAADLATCADTSLKLNCGGLAVCASGTCNQYDFWSIYESHLDKTRTGCNVK